MKLEQSTLWSKKGASSKYRRISPEEGWSLQRRKDLEYGNRTEAISSNDVNRANRFISNIEMVNRLIGVQFDMNR